MNILQFTEQCIYSSQNMQFCQLSVKKRETGLGHVPWYHTKGKHGSYTQFSQKKKTRRLTKAPTKNHKPRKTASARTLHAY